MVDVDLFERFRAGDDEAVRSIYRSYGRLVFAVAHRLLDSRQLAEEVTQQTFVKAWRAAGTFDPSRDLAPWLATIARRTAIDVHRSQARNVATAFDDASARDPAVVVELPTGAERVLEFAEVRAAVDALPPDERETVRLQHFDGLSHAEIADRLGVPIGTVKSRSHRAHRRLAARLGHLRDEG